MQKPSERHKLTSDNNIIKFKKPVYDPFNIYFLLNFLIVLHEMYCFSFFLAFRTVFSVFSQQQLAKTHHTKTSLKDLCLDRLKLNPVH